MGLGGQTVSNNFPGARLCSCAIHGPLTAPLYLLLPPPLAPMRKGGSDRLGISLKVTGRGAEPTGSRSVLLASVCTTPLGFFL